MTATTYVALSVVRAASRGNAAMTSPSPIPDTAVAACSWRKAAPKRELSVAVSMRGDRRSLYVEAM